MLFLDIPSDLFYDIFIYAKNPIKCGEKFNFFSEEPLLEK